MHSRQLLSFAFLFRPAAIAFAAWAACACAEAQDATALPPVTINVRPDAAASVAGWGDVPASKTPFQTTSISASEMLDRGMQRLADLARIDPSVSDAYNAEGYWDYLTVRGFVIDNKFNYRRDDCRSTPRHRYRSTIRPRRNIEGHQRFASRHQRAGRLGEPGRQAAGRRADPRCATGMATTRLGAGLGRLEPAIRIAGADPAAFGVRLNVAAEHLDPMVHSSRGDRHLVALAGDWRVSPDTLIEAEIESSRRSQPSQQAFSLLGTTVPAVPDPRINLNNQPWSLPVVLVGNTASLRVRQKLGPTGH